MIMCLEFVFFFPVSELVYIISFTFSHFEDTFMQSSLIGISMLALQ